MFFLRDQSPYGLAPFCRIFLLQELREYEFHPGAKSADAKGKPSGKQSFGLLRRRHVRVERIIYIGKESNQFEEIKAGVIHSPERVYTEYPDPHREEWQTKIRPLHSKENTANSQPAELDIVFAGGGTISGVTTASGSGLTSGGTSGTLNLGLTKSCAANQVLQWNGSSWVCAAVGISPAGEDATTATRFDFAQLVNSCGEHRLPRLLSA